MRCVYIVALLAAFSLNAMADSDGPSIDTLTVSSSTVSPGDTFTITAQLTDATGVKTAGFYFNLDGAQRDFCGQGPLQLQSGTTQLGIWTFECFVPATAQSGDYEIVPYAEDDVGNWTNTNCCSQSSTRAYFTLSGGSLDSDGPSIDTLTVSSSTVSPGDTFTITAQLTDATGVKTAGFYFNLDGAQRDFCGQGPLQLQSGTTQLGIWTFECFVPATAQSGDYEIVPYAEDDVGNWTNTNCCSQSSTRAYFTLSGGSLDSDGPSIDTLTVSSSTVSPGDTFTITAQLTDATGVKTAGFYFNLDGAQRDFCGQGPLQLQSGTTQLGIWTFECFVPATAQSGDYEIVPYAEDDVGNWTNTNCCSQSSTRAYFTLSGGSLDSDGPSIDTLTVSSSTVSPGDTFTITAQLTDATGVKTAGFYFNLDGAQRDFCGQGPLQLQSGTTQLGIWTFECFVPATAQSGDYEIVPYAEDDVGNWTNTNCCSQSSTRAYFNLLPVNSEEPITVNVPVPIFTYFIIGTILIVVSLVHIKMKN